MTLRISNIHERFLRHIWSRQYLQRSALRTLDGRSLRVLNVGKLNTEGGPDFRDATIKLGGTTFCGDVEIHRTPLEWLQHRHQDDPRYNKVVLHVVLEDAAEGLPTLVASGRSVPVVVLEPFLSESIRSIWQKTLLDERARTSQTIKCYHLNGSVDAILLSSWIHKLSVERLELKLRRFDERLKELAHLHILAFHERPHRYTSTRVQGNPDDIPPPLRELSQKDLSRKELWEQVLYEGLMECLGYSKNQEPFVRLARAVTLQRIRDHHVENDRVKIQAFLFGGAGLLPKIRSLREKESRNYVRALARAWRELRSMYHSAVLHAADWQFFPTRPTNFPTARLAAASVLLQKLLCDDFFRKMIQILKTPLGQEDKLRSLRELLSVGPLEFWSTHYHFDHSTAKQVRSLGPERVNDMIVNAIIPLALLYARTFKDLAVREQALGLYDVLPPSMENSLTRLMTRQLLRGKLRLDSVARQQGVIQLYKFYCLEERCAECDVGRVVFGSQDKQQSS
jgi:hypothetical protein